MIAWVCILMIAAIPVLVIYGLVLNVAASARCRLSARPPAGSLPLTRIQRAGQTAPSPSIRWGAITRPMHASSWDEAFARFLEQDHQDARRTAQRGSR